MRSVVGDRSQQGEAATLAVDRVLARREGDIASTSAPLPDGEADQLQAFELSVAEVQFGIREPTSAPAANNISIACTSPQIAATWSGRSLSYPTSLTPMARSSRTSTSEMANSNSSRLVQFRDVLNLCS
jgi:hypothetical protein